MPRRGTKHPRFDAHYDLLDGRMDAELICTVTARLRPGCGPRIYRLVAATRTGAIVHVITGKGKGSANGPLLRGLVRTLLQGELRSMVGRWSLDDSEGGYKVQLR